MNINLELHRHLKATNVFLLHYFCNRSACAVPVSVAAT